MLGRLPPLPSDMTRCRYCGSWERLKLLKPGRELAEHEPFPFIAFELAAGEGSLAPLSLHSIGGVGVCEGVPLQCGVAEDEACECIAAPGSEPFGGEAGAMGGFSSDWKPGESSPGVAIFFSGGGESAATAADLLEPQPMAAGPLASPPGRAGAGPEPTAPALRFGRFRHCTSRDRVGV